MKNKNFILITVSVLSVSIILTGCYSFRPITKEQLISKYSSSNLKFLLHDSSEIIINERDSLKISGQDTLVITKLESTQQIITFDKIQSINAEQFDFGKTLFAGFWTLFGLILVLGLLIGGSLRMG